MVNLYEKFRERKAIMFKKTRWTKDQAKDYLKGKNLKYFKIRTYKKSYWHFRLDDPDDFSNFEEYSVKYIGEGGFIVEIYATDVYNF